MIIFNGKNSRTDFDLYIASREQPPAIRKTITETVPYMSGVLDFSYHDGDIDEYEPVTIKYTFDVIADNKKELKALRNALVAWVHSKGDNKLIDTDIGETAYYSVYFAQASWSEEDLQGLLTAEFTCYPFILTDKKSVTTLAETSQAITLENEGRRSVVPTIEIASKNLLDTSIIPLGEESDIYNYVSAIAEGSITITSKEGYKGNGYKYLGLTLRELCPQIVAGRKYVLSAVSSAFNQIIYLQEAAQMWGFGEALTISNLMLNSKVAFYGYNNVNNGYGDCVISKIQIEEGDTATEYTPYVEANATINDGVNTYTLNAGEHKNVFTLKAGENPLTVSGTGLLSLTYTEEVL